MTHRNNFVAAVKCGGAILREYDGTVTLPFGSEYSILLKNLDDRKASVEISIDGQSVMGGRDIVVYPNTTAELLGFMQSEAVRNKFKFVKKTQEIVEYHGDRIDDGIVRVEFTFEKRVVEDVVHHTHVHNTYYEPWYPYPCYPRPYYPHPWYPTTYPTITYGGDVWTSTYNNAGGVSTGTGNSVLFAGAADSGTSISCSASATPSINPNEGITVYGGETYQSFIPVCLGELEENSTVITIRLVGTDTAGVAVEGLIATKDKLRCSTCGKISKSDATYCSRCGTNLR